MDALYSEPIRFDPPLVEPKRNQILSYVMNVVLTKTAIDALVTRARSSQQTLELVDDREPGLRIRAGKRKAAWSLLARLPDGSRVRTGLGTWPGMGIADARRAAQQLRVLVDKGVDPNAERRKAAEEALRAKAQVQTLAKLFKRYETQALAELRRGPNVARALMGKRGLLIHLADRDIRSVTRSDIAEAVREHANTAPIAANRNLAYARAFLNWCVDEELIDDNPAARVRMPAKETQRHRFHSLEELKEIWIAALGLGYPFSHIYRLLILIPMRRDEIASIATDELTLSDEHDPDESVWLLPSSRTKNGKALRVPVAATARSILMDAKNHAKRMSQSGLIFSTTGTTAVSGFAKAKRRIDSAIEINRKSECERLGTTYQPMPHWTVHDLRTTFSTHASERLGVHISVTDRILNHVATATHSKLARIYNQAEIFDQRKAAMKAWEQLVLETVEIASDEAIGM